MCYVWFVGVYVGVVELVEGDFFVGDWFDDFGVGDEYVVVVLVY